ncbi:MAG TPA: FHA domain-containing protein [Pyrinomonadaceae bacterium]|jgi:pSer/pThr/pTyr-binding forkhead associated (FHA) protein
MQPEVTLLVYEEAGAPRPVPVASGRFVIGGDLENDLVLDDPHVTPRHAVIESLDGVVRLSVYSSSGVVRLNGAEVDRPVRLRDGDLITLGGREVEVRIRAAGRAVKSTRPTDRRREATTGAPPDDVRERVNAESSVSKERAGGLTLPTVALSAGLALLLVGGLGWFISRRQSDAAGDGNDGARALPTSVVGSGAGPSADRGRDGSGVEEAKDAPSPPAVPEGVDDGRAARAEQVKRDARQLMRHISNDSRLYSFPDKALDDIVKKVDEHRRDAAALRAAFDSIRRGGEPLARQARAEGVSPDLVIYAGLAQIGARAASQDPLAAAREALPAVAALREKLGGDTNDGSLIIVVAYYEGAGTRKSHPLLVRLGRTDTNFSKRNVWHLRDERVIGEQTYDFLLRFLALGAIAQAPRRYGIDADPLLF